MSTEQVNQVLEDAYEWLAESEDHWCKYTLVQDANGARQTTATRLEDVKKTCLAGAVWLATQRRGLTNYGSTYHLGLQRIAEEIDGHSTLAYINPMSVVSPFNDTVATTYEDVLVTLKRAAFTD